MKTGTETVQASKENGSTIGEIALLMLTGALASFGGFILVVMAFNKFCQICDCY